MSGLQIKSYLSGWKMEGKSAHRLNGPKLQDASDDDLRNWCFIGNGIGIHWEALDEDISIDGLLKP